jgi:hypothetical protein
MTTARRWQNHGQLLADAGGADQDGWLVNSMVDIFCA